MYHTDKVIRKIVGRSRSILQTDYSENYKEIYDAIKGSNCLVLGGAGSIGFAITNELIQLEPKSLHVVDLSENALAELVRHLRSKYTFINTDLKILPLDIGSLEFSKFADSTVKYDYVLNLSALKHVRSENDPYTIMRMLQTNVFNTRDSIQKLKWPGMRKYFCVSTDKASNPVNVMGATKRIMELYLMHENDDVKVSTARFANVAFSNGSLLESFRNRFQLKQPIVAPSDISRYFVTQEEAGKICLFSLVFGDDRDIFFPKLSAIGDAVNMADIAIRFTLENGFQPVECTSEEEAKAWFEANNNTETSWPCYFPSSDTTGEKQIEEFYSAEESVDFDSFKDLGIVKMCDQQSNFKIQEFEEQIDTFSSSKNWKKDELIRILSDALPNFHHIEIGKNLSEKI